MPRDRYSRPTTPSSTSSDSRASSPSYHSRSKSQTRSESWYRSRSRPARRSYIATPSTSPSPPPPRQRSRRRGRDSSPFSSRNSSPSQSRKPPPAREKLKKDVLKTSLVFLGSVMAAAYTLEKVWPKGVTYGEKPDWQRKEETVKKVVKKAVKGVTSPRRGHGHSDGDDHDDDERHRGDERSARRSKSVDGARRQRPASVRCGYPGGVTTTVASVASGSRTDDARRERYCRDNRTEPGDRRVRRFDEDGGDGRGARGYYRDAGPSSSSTSGAPQQYYYTGREVVGWSHAFDGQPPRRPYSRGGGGY